MKKRRFSFILGILALSLLFAAPALSEDSFMFNLDLIFNKWISSGHADATSESFNHWNAEGEVSTSCARCHSSPGYLDFLGADGTKAGQVDKAAPIGTVVGCLTCHNEEATWLDEVTFPSGATIRGLGSEARCLVCHQGRESGASVDAAITASGVADDDTVSRSLGFINIHYFAAAATQYGAQAHSGYEYAGQSYDLKFDHVAGYDTCIGCHDQHSLEVRINETVRGSECKDCHAKVATFADLKNIRMNGSMVDYDGDGDTSEGIAGEISTLQEKLYTTVQAYASNVIGSPIIYNGLAYPYWFVDANGNGLADADETSRYGSWTARLVKATYNYQASLKDPGAYAHNAKYVIELLYDSIADLNSALPEAVKIDISALHRVDGPHFDGSKEAFRHWDAEGEVSASCSKCHGRYGLAEFLNYGNDRPTELTTDGMACINCHGLDAEGRTAYTEIWDTGKGVVFPSGAEVSLDNNSQLCMNCHSGRAFGGTVVAAKFSNIHYYPSAAVFFGADVQGGYEYAGKSYAGQNLYPSHPADLSTCTGCHIQMDNRIKHQFKPSLDLCNWCHTGDSFEELSGRPKTYHTSLANLADQLYTQIQSYAAAHGMTATHLESYPYWSGTNTWDINVAAAAYNYQLYLKEPAAYMHNGAYVGQLLYDAIENLGGTPAENRPAN
ncbi:MAG: hypothetical protein JXR80_05035 [Deltaproteobacteria bacterium]|nr:hypothetical protein [Deltaproteobacteria bacterium]